MSWMDEPLPRTPTSENLLTELRRLRATQFSLTEQACGDPHARNTRSTRMREIRQILQLASRRVISSMRMEGHRIAFPDISSNFPYSLLCNFNNVSCPLNASSGSPVFIYIESNASPEGESRRIDMQEDATTAYFIAQ